MNKILIIIVTHNSQKFIDWVLEPLNKCHDICDVVIVDSGSSSIEYLKKIDRFTIEFTENIGFAKANNLALRFLNENKHSHVLFLNPDARVEENILRELHSRAVKDAEGYGLFSVPLIKYDFDKRSPEVYYDSLGIECNVLGKWRDIQGPISVKQEKKIEAICGAFMLISKKAIEESKNKLGMIGFDETFFMYKEDIELSLRIRKKFKLKMYYDLYAYHCRGWTKSRKEIPYWRKKISAVNDLKLNIKYKFRALPYAIIKYIYVIIFERA